MIFFGFWMMRFDLSLVQESWIQSKLGVTALLIGECFVVDQRIYRKLQDGALIWRTYALRIWVQGSVLLLVASVFLSTFKKVQWYLGLLGLMVLAILLLFVIRAFGGKDEKHQDVNTR